MLLKYFKSNQPGVVVLVPLVAAVCWVPFFLIPRPVDSGASWPIEFLEQYPVQSWISMSLCVVLVILQALWINRIINNAEIFGRPSFIYALIFVVLSAITSYNGELTDVQLSLLFIIPALDELFDMYSQRIVTDHVFKSSVLLGIAALICPFNLVILPLPFVALYLLRAFNWREWLFALIGFGLPFLFLFTIMYARQLPFMKFYLVKDDFRMLNNISDFHMLLYVVCILLIFLALVTYMFSLSSTIIKIRKLRLLVVYLFLLCAAGIAVTFYTGIARIYLQVMILPLTALLSFYLLNTRFKLIVSGLFYLVMILYFLRNVLYDFY